MQRSTDLSAYKNYLWLKKIKKPSTIKKFYQFNMGANSKDSLGKGTYGDVYKAKRLANG